MVKEMNADESKKWLEEREKNLTPEEKRAAAESMKRFESMEQKRRIVKLVNMVETADVLLGKICSGMKELYRLPVENEMLDGALSVQSQRFRGLSEFFEARQDFRNCPEHEALSRMMREISEGIENYRMEYLSTGNKEKLQDFIKAALVAKAMVENLWRKEDEG